MPPKDERNRRRFFWSKVAVTESKSDCWLWRGKTNDAGYGLFGRDMAHRFANEDEYGPIPPGIVVRHTCDVRACCNPWHGVRGTHADNVADRVARGRSARGTQNGRAKLDPEKVRRIRKDTRRAIEIAKAYGVDPKVIYNIKQGKSWRHVL